MSGDRWYPLLQNNPAELLEVTPEVTQMFIIQKKVQPLQLNP